VLRRCFATVALLVVPAVALFAGDGVAQNPPTCFGQLATKFVGGPGPDRMIGTSGPDVMVGGPGDDTQNGGPDGDVILGNLGRDVSDGGDGNDHLWILVHADVTGPGDIAGDVARGGPGNDVIHARDGELDVVSCGDGFDVAMLDMVDAIEGATAALPDGDCERVRRAEPRPDEDAAERDPAS